MLVLQFAALDTATLLGVRRCAFIKHAERGERLVTIALAESELAVQRYAVFVRFLLANGNSRW